MSRPALLALALVPLLATAAEPCPDLRGAALVRLSGGTPTERETVETELAVEARRLGLAPCASGPGAPRATVDVTMADGEAKVVVSAGARTVERTVPFSSGGATGDQALQLGVVAGELLRAAFQPTARPAGAELSVGARGALDGYPGSQGWLVGGDVVLRLQLARLAVELHGLGRGAPAAAVPAGSVQLAAAGGGLAVALGLVTGPVRLELLAGATAAALFLTATPGVGASGQSAIRAVVDARAGLGLAIRLPPLVLSLSSGVTVPLLGAVATADGTPVAGLGGVGVFATLGLRLPTRTEPPGAR